MVRFLFPLLVVIITVEGHATAGHLSNITGHPTQDDGSMNIVAEYVDLPIDHSNPAMGTYKNRFWVNDQYYQEGGPVFVHDGGETNGEKHAKDYLFNSSSYLGDLLRKFKGIGVFWEHRYFGDSSPFPINATTSYDRFQYLSVEQALADLPQFAQNFSRASHPEQDLTPRSTPWVMIGCSYAGARASWSRQKYPDTFTAAYASSAPVEAQTSFTSTFDQIYRGMVSNGYANCSRDMHHIITYVDTQLSTPHTASHLKQLFFGPGAEQNSNSDVAMALASIYGAFQTEGMGTSNTSLASLCNHLEQDPATSQSAPKTGLFPLYGAEYLTQRLASWPSLVSMVNQNSDTNCRGLNSSLPISCDLSEPPSPRPDAIAWTWLQCSQLGYFPQANTGSRALVSKYLTSHRGLRRCRVRFPGAVESGALPAEPATRKLNAKTGGLRMRPSNTFWTAGEFDPWRALSPLSTEDFAPANVTVTTNASFAGEGRIDEVLGYVLASTEHCVDFKPSVAEAVAAREHFVHALKGWLKR